MAGLIDVAYVEILPDLKRFDKQVMKDIKASLVGAAREADKATKQIGESLADSVKEGTKEAKVWIDKLGREIREVDGTIHIKTVIDGKETVEVLKRDLQGRFRKENGQFASAGELAGLGITDGISDGISLGGSAIQTSLLGALRGALNPAGAALIAAGAAVAVQVTAAIAPAVIALGASIPAAVGIAGASIATLTLGLSGLSDAIKNFDDDEKFQEALKNLSPAAGRFATEMRGLVPVFKSIKNAAQEGIFKGLEGELTRITLTLQGPLRVGFNEVGRSLQGIGKQFAAFVTSRVGIDALNAVFGTTANIFNNLSGAIAPFFQGLAKLTISATPFVEKLAASFSGFLADVGTKLSALADSGALEKFFDRAYETLSKVWDIGKDVFDIFKGIFSSAESSGQGLLDSLKEMTGEIKKFFDNKTNVEALKTSFELFAGAVGLLWGAFKVAIVSTRRFLEDLDALDRNIDKFVEDIKKFGKNVEEQFNKAKDTVGKFVDGVGNWFAELPGKIETSLKAIPGFVADTLKNVLASALQAVGVGVGLLLSFFSELPVAVGNALVGLWNTVTTFFTNLWTSVSVWTETKWNEIVSWVSLLPARIQEALSTLPGILENFFVTLWLNVKQWAVDNWNSIVDWISQVPDRIAALAVNFYNSGINLIKGFFRGISSGADNAASGVGDAVYQAFRSALNWAVSQINEGISSIDDALPGSLPRIPYLATGGIATGPMLAGIGEAGDEAVLPLSGQRGRRTLQMLADAANGGGNNFEPGAIVVTFEGALPTKDQAFQVGEAVGNGINSILAKRDVRTRIRMA